MFNISSFLKKTQIIVSDDLDNRQKIKDIIKKCINIEYNQDLIVVKNNILYIKGNNILKSLIFINKEKLLLELRSLSVLDIR